MVNLLNQEVTQQIETILKQAKNDITIVLFTKSGDCPTCKETTQLLEEVSALSERITLTKKDINDDETIAKQYGITLTPSFVLLDSENNYQGVKFNGIPAGHEINSFITALLEMAGQPIQYDETVKARISTLQKDVNIKVFVTLSCPHCPGAVQNAHRIAMLNKNIEGEMIEAQTFGPMANRYDVSGVPKIVINDEHELVGNQPVEAFLDIIEKL